MKTDNQNQSYVLSGATGKIANALAKYCASGEMGEPLIRNGVSQGAFVLFLAKMAKRYFDGGRSVEQVAEVLSLLSGGNASAAKQALNDLNIRFADEPAVDAKHPEHSVGKHWEQAGGTKSAPNLSILDL